MAQQFLDHLFQPENRIKPELGQCCPICLEECGSPSPEGIVERLVRPPCNHLVGSNCIATWLHGNTCLVCRREFFPAEPRLYPEYGTIAAGGSDVEDGDEEQNGLDRLIGVIEWSSRELDLSPEACRLSIVIGRRAFGMDLLRDSSRREKAAMSIFVASHLVSDPVTVDEIAEVVELSGRTIYDTYRHFYPARRAVMDREFLLLLDEDPAQWPSTGANEFWEMIAERLNMTQEYSLFEVSRILCYDLMDKPYSNAVSISSIIALSIYLAGHLKDIPIPLQEIASVMGGSLDEVQALHALFYPHRKDLLEIQIIWMDDNFRRLIDDLPREMRIPL